jgi:hypothetical protein
MKVEITHARMHTRTHARTHACTHGRARAHTYTHCTRIHTPTQRSKRSRQ